MEEGIRYVRSGGVAIAYQVVGEGEIDLVCVPDFVSNLVYGGQSPRWRAFYERLARSFRLILFDKRGTGLSDHGPQFAALETQMEDLRAVLEAASSPKAIVLGAHEGCAMAALYAASYPERTRALALFQPPARGPGIANREDELAAIRDGWGTQEFSDEPKAVATPPWRALLGCRGFGNVKPRRSSPFYQAATKLALSPHGNGDRAWAAPASTAGGHHLDAGRHAVRFKDPGPRDALRT